MSKEDPEEIRKELLAEMDEAAKKAESLLNEDLPQSLQDVLGHRDDHTILQTLSLERAIADLYQNCNLQGRFRELYGLRDNLVDHVVTRVQAYQELDSQEKMKQFILDVLTEGKNPYAFATGGSSTFLLENFYQELITTCNLDCENLEPFRERLNMFEEAIFEIILDDTSYFHRVKYEDPDTPWSYVGQTLVQTVISPSLSDMESPNISDGRYIDRVRSKIKYEELKEDLIDDTMEISRQGSLLFLYWFVHSPKQPVDRKFYDDLKGNPNILPHCQNVLFEMGVGDPDVSE